MNTQMIVAPPPGGGFREAVFGAYGDNVPEPNVTFAQRFGVGNAGVETAAMARMEDIQNLTEQLKRGDFGGDVSGAVATLAAAMGGMQRAVTSAMTAFPVRENLEAEAKILVPLETPLRNMFPRTLGSGKASAWKVATSLGGGYGATGTTTGATDNAAGQATVTLTADAATAGFAVGDAIQVGTETTVHIVTAINGVAMTIEANLGANQYTQTVTKVNVPGGGSTKQIFYAEDGAPDEVTTVYADKSATYKLMGVEGGVSGFSMAAGANFQNQYMTERQHALLNLMLLEEFALINASSTAVKKPWGDGTNALSFDGMLSSIATGNGTPANQIKTSAGTLTFAMIDDILVKTFFQGARNQYIVLSPFEMVVMKNLQTASGSIMRVVSVDQADMKAGFKLSFYVHPVTGELIPLIPDRFLAKGTMIIGAMQLPMGQPAFDVDVLPKVQLPELGPNEMVQGYTIQELAPTKTAPEMFYFLCSVYEVARIKSGTVFGAIKGITG